MNIPAEIPMLAGLSNVELAKLTGELHPRSFPAGSAIVEPTDPLVSVFFLTHGEAEVSLMEGENLVPLLLLGPGDMIGESAVFGSGGVTQHVRALSDVTAYELSVQRFQRLLQSEPSIARDLLRLLSARKDGTVKELARVRTMLSAYVDAVWSEVQPPIPHQSAAALSTQYVVVPPATPEQASAPQRRAPKPKGSWTDHPVYRFLGIAGTTALSVIIFFAYHGPRSSGLATSILLWAALNWLLGTIPDYAVALSASVMAVVAGVATPAVAFSGFAQPAWFLLLGVLGIGVAVSRSGLLYRLALNMLRLLPTTYVGQSFALAITGILFTPLLPSANSRSALASPLARELSEAMRFPAQGKGSAGLAMSSFFGFGQMYFMFLNGTNICMLAWSLMPAMARREITWGTWFWYALPVSLVTFFGCFLSILYLLRAEPTKGVSSQTISTQLRVLGPMSRTERTTVVVLALVLLGFMTQGIHGLDPAWLALPGFLSLVLFGVIDKNGLKAMDWGFLLLVGALVSLSDVTKAAGLNDQLTAWIGPLLRPLGSSPYLFLAAIGLLMVLVRLAVPIQQAVLVMVISLLPIAQELHYHPFIILLVVLSLSTSWIIPQQNSMYMTVYSGTEEQCFTHRQVRPLAVIQSLISILAVVAAVPFWQMLHLIPK